MSTVFQWDGQSETIEGELEVTADKDDYEAAVLATAQSESKHETVYPPFSAPWTTAVQKAGSPPTAIGLQDLFPVKVSPCRH